ncbi:DEAD/DEAH box helicase [uncultured Ornithinimicrobium sp.]|uniref:DEAD/DEAH box helicase n=1 Tax=uncultured Ornithinimicrobium sp. TaxID=259307 RepID=UPI0025984A49|nr:DEAD/DEAH box helicase [uncultured Ornithinimicrobium sp.]
MTTTSIDAIGTAEEITTSYRRYLRSLLAVRDPQLSRALRDTIDRTRLLDKGPYLEATPPYRAGSSPEDLIDEGVLGPGFRGLDSPALPLTRPLYAHQDAALRKVRAGRNVVVATGTGSGKTESFLLPILDDLVRESEAGTLGPGVRALLLYPMNALANDQLKRLRQLLAGRPEITFGRYTGDTRNSEREARENFSVLNPGEPVLPNELLSRERMRETPPHILLTNYAMLEYLLLRPLDMELFAPGSSRWRYIVVDEAHVYDGTQGAEIGMLLRRLKDRVAPGSPLQCIATSATVGGDADSSAVTTFASQLFGERFEWVDGDPERQDLITAARVVPSGAAWGPLTAADYRSLAASPDPAARLHELAPGEGTTDPADLLRREAGMATLRTTLAAGATTVERAASRVFPGQSDAVDGLAALVAVGSAMATGDGSPVLSARYHLFLRSTEGAFACFSPTGPHVELSRHDDCPTCAASMFEIGSCKRCGAVHVVGRIEQEGRIKRLRPRHARSETKWLVLDSAETLVDEDEVAVESQDVPVQGDAFVLCTTCGGLSPTGHASCQDSSCGARTIRPVRLLKSRGNDGVAGCLVCGARGEATVRLFETGPDASNAVLATVLYQHLPGQTDESAAVLPGEGRKLLMFSDNRQSAAFFAPYLEDSYLRLQRRRLIAQGLVRSGADEEPVAVDDLIFQVGREGKRANLFGPRDTAQMQMRQVAPWVMAEVVATDDRTSLEGLGLLSVRLARDPSWPAPAPLLQLGLGEDEAWDLIEELLRTLRQQGVVTMPDLVAPDDEVFAPRLGPIHARLEGPTPRRKVLSWLPGRGANRRVDFVGKVLTALGSDQDPIDVLRGVWKYVLAESTPVDWLRQDTLKGVGSVSQVDHELLRLGWVGPEAPVWRCTVCRRTAPVSIRGVCPALRCTGRLEPFHPDPDQDTDHYRHLYRTMTPVPLRALEHTAQWRTEEATAIQNDFIKGKVNALSCSTTFELGVDVGELQAVLLRNMPPSTANYVQRAGRAGRRAGAAALVVTFAQRRSHDLTKYADPSSMMSGEVRAPYVPLANVRIDRRHAHSVALAAYFRDLFETTDRHLRKVEEFFLPPETDPGAPAPVEGVAGFLSPMPDHIEASLRHILPAEVHEEFGLSDGSWVTALTELLSDVTRELTQDLGTLEDLVSDAVTHKRFGLAKAYTGVSETLRRRDLLGFLANRNVLPKYGFPVDTVELRTGFGTDGSGAKLELTRDLSQAIYEYAPGSSVVAGGQVWTSRGLYRLPGRDLVEKTYAVCHECGAFRESMGAVEPVCPTCDTPSRSAPRTFTVPEFGFVADRESTRPGARPPRRSWSGSTYVLKESDDVHESSIPVAGGEVRARFGPRGRLVNIADGPGRAGFWVCDWCGYAVPMAHSPKPPDHDSLRRRQPCHGHSRRLDLAHSFETDLLRLDLAPSGMAGDRSSHLSTLYALLESACDTLQIAREDLGGTLLPVSKGAWSFVLYDTVPGGAGHALQAQENLARIVDAALARVSTCDCGPETSCYGCLRSYGNQRDHDVLSRGRAQTVLQLLSPA